MSELLLGDEAVGLAAIDAGISGMFGYPGTPSTEIFEFVQQRTKNNDKVIAKWSANEKLSPTRRRWACPSRGSGPLSQ